MEDAKDPTSRDTDEILYSELIGALPNQAISAIETMLGKELSPSMRSRLRVMLETLASSAQGFSEQVDCMKGSGDMSALAKAADQYLRAALPETVSAPSAIEHVRTKLFSPAVPGFDYIRESKYSNYVDSLKILINQAMEKSLSDVISYTNSVDSEVADIQSWGQFMATEMGRVVRHLAHNRRRFSRGLATRCIDEYGKMSGVYEQLIRILAGFSLIGSQAKLHFNDFAKRSLAGNLDTLNERGWGIFSADFDNLVRNAIAHKSWVVQPVEKTVRFSDKRSQKQESLSYRQLFGKTRELSCLVLALGQFPGLVQEAILAHLASLLPKQ